MKILHINTYQFGGAALCAMRIGFATSKEGVEVKFLTSDGEEHDNVYVAQKDFSMWNTHGFLRKIKNLMIKLHLGTDAETWRYIIDTSYRYKHPFSVPLSDYSSLSDHPLVKEADIIHLHWISGFVDYPSFFRKVKKPIIWTIHDENPGLGISHYIMWRDSMGKEMRKLERHFVEIKKEALKAVCSLNLVAISSEMKHFLETNEILHSFPVSLIHNGIDGDVFYPSEKEVARKKLSLGGDKIIFLFVAYFINEDRKGLSDLLSVLEKLHIENLTLVCIGNFSKKPDTSIDIRCVGLIRDVRILSEYYSAVDYFCMPSYQEAFAQTPMEAMACGTPVVAYPCSGARDLINENNGVLCSDFTVDALYRGIKEAMSKQYDREWIRKDLLERFSYDVIAKEYIDLYRKSLL